MPNETQQPLREQPPRSTDDTRLVAEVLGGEAAADMEELVGGQAKELPVTPNELEASIEEKVATTEAENDFAEKRREEYLIWAEDDLIEDETAEEFLDDHGFIFNSDGTVDMDKNFVGIGYLGISELPPSLNKIDGSFILSNTNINDLSNLPKIIKDDLWINDITATSIPKGVKINGKIHIKPNQKELIQDLKQKGYSNVNILKS